MRVFCTFGLYMLFTIISISSHATGDERILLQSTTSTQNSGLYDYILPKFTEDTGLDVHVVAVGTGQAIRNAENGDADILIVHSLLDEDKFISDGYGLKRFNLMYNDFVIIGPKEEATKFHGLTRLDEVMEVLSKGAVKFISRGDNSGTHKKELQLWDKAGIVEFDPVWYLEAGSGMGTTIRTTIELNGITITDRATWLAYGRKENYTILYSKLPDLFNQYGVIVVNPNIHPHVNFNGALRLQQWLLSPKGQTTINSYQMKNHQLFFANAD